MLPDLHCRDAYFFDLDDTLIDTTGTLVAPALRAAANAMLAAGLQAKPGPLSDYLLDCSRRQRGDDCFAGACRHFRLRPGTAPQTVTAAGRSAFLDPPLTSLARLPAASELLASLQAHHLLFLVTSGNRSSQARKVATAEIGAHFTAIRYVDDGAHLGKIEAFRELLDEHRLDASRCVCVGDRRQVELRCGRELGMLTVWVRRGEFVHATSDHVPDITVDNPAQLLALWSSQQAVPC